MRRPPLALACLAALASWAGCSSGDSGGPADVVISADAPADAPADAAAEALPDLPPAGPCGVSPSNLVDKFEDAFDAWLQRCVSVSTLAERKILRERFLNAAMKPLWAALATLVAQGKVTLDADELCAYLQAVGSGDCNAVSTAANGISGTAGAGGACHLDEECQAGMYCDLAACPGSCKSKVAHDQPCNAAEPSSCEAGWTCDVETAACVAVEVVKKVGDPCDGKTDRCALGVCAGGKCVPFPSEDGACPLPDTCTLATCSAKTKTCVALQPKGGECKLWNDCEDGLYCPSITEALSGTCTPLKPDGEGCNPTWTTLGGMARQCRSGICKGTGTSGFCSSEIAALACPP